MSVPYYPRSRKMGQGVANDDRWRATSFGVGAGAPQELRGSKLSSRRKASFSTPCESDDDPGRPRYLRREISLMM